MNLNGTERFLSAAGGTVLLLSGLRRLRHGRLAGLGLGLVGGALLGRGVSGRSRLYGSLGISTTGGRVHVDTTATGGDEARSVRRSVTILRAPAELYALWRDFERLPRFIDRLERVETLSATRSRWIASGPRGRQVEWEAEITEDRQGERIAWRTVGPADVPHRAELRFRPAPGGRGTEVALAVAYEPPGGRVGRAVAGILDHPPGGRVGRAVAEFLGASAAARVAAALRRFKQIAEAGEAATTEGQPSGRAGRAQ